MSQGDEHIIHLHKKITSNHIHSEFLNELEEHENFMKTYINT